MKTRQHKNKNEWDITVSIPFCDVAEYLSDDEYEAVKNSIADQIKIKLTFDYCPADPETGIFIDSMDYCEWDWADTIYSASVERAITLYIADTDMEEKYGDKAMMERADYYNYLKYGERL